MKKCGGDRDTTVIADVCRLVRAFSRRRSGLMSS